MRKNMTRALDEFLSGSATRGSDVVYIGEDVEHGGYYLVTEGLKKKCSLLSFVCGLALIFPQIPFASV
jgi:pyruvate/2-oxoglutarate/acetoin dehydrogenase E1 component